MLNGKYSCHPGSGFHLVGTRERPTYALQSSTDVKQVFDLGGRCLCLLTVCVSPCSFLPSILDNIFMFCLFKGKGLGTLQPARHAAGGAIWARRSYEPDLNAKYRAAEPHCPPYRDSLLQCYLIPCLFWFCLYPLLY